MFFAVSFRARRYREREGIEKVGSFLRVVMRYLNVLPANTEDKTAPRRRIRRVNRHLLFLPFSFPSLVSSTAVTGGAAIFSLQLLGEERSCSTFFLFFVSAAAQREKKRSSIRFIDESDPE